VGPKATHLRPKAEPRRFWFRAEGAREGWSLFNVSFSLPGTKLFSGLFRVSNACSLVGVSGALAKYHICFALQSAFKPVLVLQSFGAEFPLGLFGILKDWIELWELT